MSRSASVVAVLALACVVATATAAAQGARLGIGGGATAPQGEFKADANGEGFNPGWQGTVFLEFREPRKPLGLRVDAFLGENSGNDQLNADFTASVGRPVTNNMRMLGGNVDVIYRLGRVSRGGGGYLFGGIGSYRVKVTLSYSSGGVVADTSETKFALDAGGGLTFPIGKAAMFVEARYVTVTSALFPSKSGTAPFVAAVAGFRLGRS